MSGRTRSEDVLTQALEGYFTRLDLGERPDPEEFIRKYPECADELRLFFQDLNFVRERVAAHQRLGMEEMSLSLREPSRMENASKFADARSGLGSVIGPSNRSPMLRVRGMAPDAGAGELDQPTESDKESVNGQELPRIAGFRLISELGSGSQGVVYKAEQLSTRRVVALKVVRDGAFASIADRRRFENEVHLASRLRHPNIVAVYECGRDAGRDYFAMEQVDGEPLDLYCSKSGLSPRETVRLFLRVCRAVSYAHQQGVLHRDLKPSNVLVDAEGEPHILDFGLAKPLAESTTLHDTTLTHVGHFAGTWSYASPEQVRMDPTRVDVRSDVYTLGVILYEMLTDCSPYPVTSASRETLIDHILRTPPLSPSSILREIDFDLEAIVLRALSKEPEDRYQSAAALADDLVRYLAGDAIEARRNHTWYVLSRLVRRHRWQVLGLAGALLLLIGFTITLFVLYTQARVARATSDVRMDIVRESQRWTLGHLDELHRVRNALARIQEKQGTTAEIRRAFERPTAGLPRHLDAVIAGVPPNMHLREGKPNEPPKADVIEWLDANAASLDELVLLLETDQISLAAEDQALPDTLGALPLGLDKAMNSANALIALARLQNARGDVLAAVKSLSSARKIALDLGDGRILTQKGISHTICARLYATCLWFLRDNSRDFESISPYVQWAFNDPPPATLRLALISERTKLAQIIADASMGSPQSEAGTFDLDLLNARVGGLIGDIDELTNANRQLARTISSKDAIAAVDFLVEEASHWDRLHVSDLLSRQRKTLESLNAMPAWKLLRMVSADHVDFFQAQAICRVHRAAMLAWAAICDFRRAVGRWPLSLDEVGSKFPQISLNDPYTGAGFGYRLIDGAPVLYSLGSDHSESFGRDGPWGTEGVDIMVFGPYWGSK